MTRKSCGSWKFNRRIAWPAATSGISSSKTCLKLPSSIWRVINAARTQHLHTETSSTIYHDSFQRRSHVLDNEKAPHLPSPCRLAATPRTTFSRCPACRSVDQPAFGHGLALCPRWQATTHRPRESRCATPVAFVWSGTISRLGYHLQWSRRSSVGKVVCPLNLCTASFRELAVLHLSSWSSSSFTLCSLVVLPISDALSSPSQLPGHSSNCPSQVPSARKHSLKPVYLEQ